MALNLKPYSDKHAIKNVVFALEFSQPVQSDFLRSIREGKVSEQLEKELPRVIEQKSLVFNFANFGTNLNVPVGGTPQPLGGISYDRLRPNGEAEWAVTINQMMILVTCGQYSRWAGIWPQLKSFLLALLPDVLTVTSIGVVGLQYLDEFSSIVRKEDFTLGDLFVANSEFLPSNLVKSRGQCHSHHGYFEDVEQPVSGKILTNINVDVVEQPSRMVVAITGSHRCTPVTPLAGMVAEELLRDDGIVTRIWEKLHQCNKRILGDILTPEVKALISFDTPQHNNGG
ncbi:TIGR04255 family protein [Paraburkholderia aspalathi]|uniref:TIGR04255 family protein n=1 Tax=Paraburkholderia aspalathi TaxID=1324617 RepID=UPI0038B6B7B3